jgi:hypothetical protein
MDEVDIPSDLASIEACGAGFSMMSTSFFLGRQKLIAAKDTPGMAPVARAIVRLDAEEFRKPDGILQAADQSRRRTGQPGAHLSLRYLLLAAMVLAAPYAASAEEPICTDRPAKANAICTVPAGYYQLESSLAGWSVTEVGGVRAEYLAIAPAVVKIGLSNRSDLQVAFTPHARLRVRAGGETNRTSGFGDIVVRYKHRFSRAGAPVQMALIPFVKLPAASRGLGNDKVEGGVALPIGFSLGRSVTAVLGPEVDLLTG